MAALSDRKLEAFAQAMLRNLSKGMTRGKAAVDAAKEAGYGGSSLAANARKRANRVDVKARMIELAAPKQAETEAQLAIDVTTAKQRLARIMHASLSEAVKPSDVIAAVRQLAAIEGWNAPAEHHLMGKNGEALPPINISGLSNAQLDQIIERLAAGIGLGSGAGSERADS